MPNKIKDKNPKEKHGFEQQEDEIPTKKQSAKHGLKTNMKDVNESASGKKVVFRVERQARFAHNAASSKGKESTKTLFTRNGISFNDAAKKTWYSIQMGMSGPYLSSDRARFNIIEIVSGKEHIDPKRLQEGVETKSKPVKIPKSQLGIPRRTMPQIRSDLVPDYLKWLAKMGISHKVRNIAVSSLKITQKEINKDKVQGMVDGAPEASLSKPIISSKDGFILDG